MYLDRANQWPTWDHTCKTWWFRGGFLVVGAQIRQKVYIVSMLVEVVVFFHLASNIFNRLYHITASKLKHPPDK